MNDDYITKSDAISLACEAADEWDGGPNKCRSEYIRDAIEGASPADVRPVWISVKERLPETCTFVLACFDDVQVIAFYGNYQWHEAFSNQVFYPTYWMPLPEFPKEAPE